jgi:hypothetical protein
MTRTHEKVVRDQKLIITYTYYSHADGQALEEDQER